MRKILQDFLHNFLDISNKYSTFAVLDYASQNALRVSWLNEDYIWKCVC